MTATQNTGAVRLGFLSPAAIHYQVPLYRLLAEDPRLDFTAIFASDKGIRPGDHGYGQPIAWHGDHLGGYNSRFLRRASQNDSPPYGALPSLRDIDVISCILREKFEVLWLHGYNHPTLQMAMWTQRLRRRPVIIREDQTLVHPRSLVKTLVKEIALRAAFRDGPAMYVGTESRRWLEHYGVPSERLSFVPHAVDSQLFSRDSERLRPRRAQLRSRFGIRPNSGPVILTVSRLVSSKQPQAVIEAFRRVRKQCPCSLLIVGTGELEGGLKAYVQKECIPDVVFAGFLNRDQIAEAYVSADIFVLFSNLNETWGVAVNEAMNFSLPVVVSDRCGCARDLVRDGYNGYVVPSEDTSRLADRLGKLIKDDRLRDSFGAEGRNIISPWSYDAAALGVINAVELAVGQTRWRRAGP